jgi:hypothetical protein
MSFLGLFRSSLRGYKKLWSRILKVFILFAAAVLSGVVIVFPLWYVSTRHKDLYGISALIILGIAALGVFVKNFLRGITRAGGFTEYVKFRVLPLCGKTAAGLSAILGIYGIILLFAYKNYILGVGAVIVFAIFFGIILSSDAK